MIRSFNPNRSDVEMAEVDEASRSLLGRQRWFGSTGTEGARGPRSSDSGPIYYDTQQTPTARLLQLSFMVIVVIMVLISFILSIYRCVLQRDGLYILLGLGLVGFLIVNCVLILFIRYGDLSPEKSPFLYFVGGCIIIEAILTSVLLFKV